MAVMVTVTRNGAGTPTQKDTHSDAKHFFVRDAMLFVVADTYSDSKVLAAYAPGQWSSVLLED